MATDKQKMMLTELLNELRRNRDRAYSNYMKNACALPLNKQSDVKIKRYMAQYNRLVSQTDALEALLDAPPILL
jgi:hypothetical protein